MLLPPDWASSSTTDTLVEHFNAVGRHMPTMIVTAFFSHMGPRSQDRQLGVIRELYERCPDLVAVKDDLLGEAGMRMCMLVHDRWAVVSGGWMSNHTLQVPYGVDGYLCLIMSFRPDIAWRYFDAVREGRYPDAWRVVREIEWPLRDLMGSFGVSLNSVWSGTGCRSCSASAAAEHHPENAVRLRGDPLDLLLHVLQRYRMRRQRVDLQLALGDQPHAELEVGARGPAHVQHPRVVRPVLPLPVVVAGTGPGGAADVDVEGGRRVIEGGSADDDDAPGAGAVGGRRFRQACSCSNASVPSPSEGHHPGVEALPTGEGGGGLGGRLRRRC